MSSSEQKFLPTKYVTSTNALTPSTTNCLQLLSSEASTRARSTKLAANRSPTLQKSLPQPKNEISLSRAFPRNTLFEAIRPTVRADNISLKALFGGQSAPLPLRRESPATAAVDVRAILWESLGRPQRPNAERRGIIKAQPARMPCFHPKRRPRSFLPLIISILCRCLPDCTHLSPGVYCKTRRLRIVLRDLKSGIGVALTAGLLCEYAAILGILFLDSLQLSSLLLFHACVVF